MNMLACACGATFRSVAAEARHRHNWPLYCRVPKKAKPGVAKPPKTFRNPRRRDPVPKDAK